MSRHKTILVGATSGIAVEIAKELAKLPHQEIILWGRKPHRLNQLKSHLETLVCKTDSSTGESPEKTIRQHETNAPITQVVIATGWMENTPAGNCHTEKCIRETYEANTILPIQWCEATIQHAREFKQPIQLVVLGSVAGDRGRASNHLYGSAKAAIETYCDGLAHRISKEKIPVSLLFVKPGITRTAMTSGMKPSLLASHPNTVACHIVRKLELSQRETYQKTYAPGWWAAIMTIIRNVPQCLLWKTNL